MWHAVGARSLPEKKVPGVVASLRSLLKQGRVKEKYLHLEVEKVIFQAKFPVTVQLAKDKAKSKARGGQDDLDETQMESQVRTRVLARAYRTYDGAQDAPRASAMSKQTQLQKSTHAKSNNDQSDEAEEA